MNTKHNDRATRRKVKRAQRAAATALQRCLRNGLEVGSDRRTIRAVTRLGALGADDVIVAYDEDEN